MALVEQSQNLEAGKGENSLEGWEWFPLGANLGLGAILGFSCGYFLKKVSKMIFFFLGLLTIILVLLSQLNIIIINWETLEKLFDVKTEEVNGIIGLLGWFVAWLRENIPLGQALRVDFGSGSRSAEYPVKP